MPVSEYLTSGTQLIYENDVNGNRVRNTISGISDNFYFNGADGKTEAVCLAPYSDNLTYNIPGAGGDNIGQVKVVGANPTRYYYLKDHLGSIKMTVDATGTVQGYDDYYPYGMQMTGRSMTSSEDGRYKFTGKERDASEGLDYFGARYYDSWKPGWDQVDPMSDEHPEENPYNYVMDNPIKNVDFDGDSATVINGFLTLDPVLSTAKQNSKYISGWMNWFTTFRHAVNKAANLGYPDDKLGFVNTSQGTRWYEEIPAMNIDEIDLPFIPEESEESIAAKVFEYAMKSEKFDHIFQAKHDLDPLINRLGGEENLLKTIIKVVMEDHLSPGVFEVSKDIEGTSVIIRGFIDTDQTIKIGTAFVPQ
jgi:RHS repeat-associated protein